MASPVISVTLHRSRSMVAQTSCGSNLGISTTVLPSNQNRSVAHWAAPCMSGGMQRLMSGVSFFAARSASSCSEVIRSLV
jgi:hypothetical protein